MKILPLDFWVTFSAVMAANLLTVGFVYAAFMYSKRERGEEGIPYQSIFSGLLLPFAFLIGALFLISTTK